MPKIRETFINTTYIGDAIATVSGSDVLRVLTHVRRLAGKTTSF